MLPVTGDADTGGTETRDAVQALRLSCGESGAPTATSPTAINKPTNTLVRDISAAVSGQRLPSSTSANSASTTSPSAAEEGLDAAG
jgi:hypothetical protein